MSFAKDNEAFLRSQGYSGTRFDAPRDKGLTEKNKHLYDSIVKYAGDDGELTQAEYEKIYTDRGPWGKYAYNQDSVAHAVAKAAVDKGFKVNQNTLDRHDLAYDGDDIMAKIEAGRFAPDMQDKDKYTWERSISEDDDDHWNVFRYKGGAAATDPDPTPVDPDPVDPDPDPFNPDPVVPPGGTLPGNPDPGTNIPEPKVGGGGFEDDWDPSGRRLGLDLTPAEQMGSIPFVTSKQYGNRYKSGRFVDFIDNQPTQSSKLANSLIASMWDDSDAFLS